MHINKEASVCRYSDICVLLSLIPIKYSSSNHNYGFIPNTVSGDGEELDAYILGVDAPLATFTGRCIAIIHRTNDNDDKLVVVPDGQNLTNEYIEQKTAFQEQWFKHTIVR